MIFLMKNCRFCASRLTLASMTSAVHLEANECTTLQASPSKGTTEAQLYFPASSETACSHILFWSSCRTAAHSGSVLQDDRPADSALQQVCEPEGIFF